VSSDATTDGDAPDTRASRTAPENEVVIEATGLKKHFDQSSGVVDRLLGASSTVKAVDGVDLRVREGETLAVVGESGCGKSTLGETLLNLQTATEGSVRYRGEELTGRSGREMRPFRRQLQMVFQDPLASLNPRQTVGDVVTAPMEVHDGGDADQRTARAEELLELVGLERGHMDRYPGQFSGGQQQRVGIARALSVEPELIVADEPVSALDVSVQAQILNLLDGLRAELGLSLLFITHDLSVVRHIADRVAVMYLGEIVETAPTDELFADPRHPYTKSLLSAVPRIDPGARTDRTILPGTVPSPIDPPTGCRFHTRCPAVIPPEDWTGDQDAFRAVFTFRNRLIDGDIDPTATAARLGTDDEGAIADHVIERSLDVSLAALPTVAAETIEEAARLIAADDLDAARTRLAEAFPSPCEELTPARVDRENDGWAACHRPDDDAPGRPELR